MNNQQKLFSKMQDMTRKLMQGSTQSSDATASATAVIQKALRDAGLTGNSPPASPPTPTPTPTFGNRSDASGGPVMQDINPPPSGKTIPPQSDEPIRASTAAPGAMPRDGKPPAFKANDNKSAAVSDLLEKLGVSLDGIGLGKMPGKTAPEPLPEGAQFIRGKFANPAGTRDYKLYVPACYAGQSLPLVVMLHGCTQDADDFAAGTQMNAAAELQQCLVLYPQQSQGANSSKCWNWFNAADQKRDAGEPSIIAGMTREVIERYGVDPRQVFIAGLSAGGAMAAIMGTTYPDLYAGVAVHSGLPYGAATDLPSALAAMKSGMTRTAPQPQQDASVRDFKGIPIIVFHGDADHTVNQKNGEQVLASVAPATSGDARSTREAGKAANSRPYTHTVRSDASGKPVAEHWLIHGFGHAWAGGSPKGSYTDARGPDATSEMMRFFYTSSTVGNS